MANECEIANVVTQAVLSALVAVDAAADDAAVALRADSTAWVTAFAISLSFAMMSLQMRSRWTRRGWRLTIAPSTKSTPVTLRNDQRRTIK